MSETLTEFASWAKSLGSYSSWTGPSRDEYRRRLRALAPEDRWAFLREDLQRLIAEVRWGEARSVASPSGKYRLEISVCETGKSSWDYSRGRVFRSQDDLPLFDFVCNYDRFPFLFLEDHSGHDFLLAAEDYQGQTLFCLDTGEVRRHLPLEALDGHAFCWSEIELLGDGRTLLVEGCHWACPYEFRLYDASDLLGAGWPEVQIVSADGEPMSLDHEELSRVTFAKGEIRYFSGERRFIATGEYERELESVWSSLHREVVRHQPTGGEALALAKAALATHDSKYLDHEEAPHLWEEMPKRMIWLRRDGDKATVVTDWTSPVELERSRKTREYLANEAKVRNERRAADPLWRALEARLGGALLSSLTGSVYPSQNSRDRGDKNAFYLSVSLESFNPDVTRRHSGRLEWGIDEGDVTLKRWVYGKGDIEPVSFPRTLDGVLEAWEAGWKHLLAEPGRASSL